MCVFRRASNTDRLSQQPWIVVMLQLEEAAEKLM